MQCTPWVCQCQWDVVDNSPFCHSWGILILHGGGWQASFKHCANVNICQYKQMTIGEGLGLYSCSACIWSWVHCASTFETGLCPTKIRPDSSNNTTWAACKLRHPHPGPASSHGTARIKSQNWPPESVKKSSNFWFRLGKFLLGSLFFAKIGKPVREVHFFG